MQLRPEFIPDDQMHYYFCAADAVVLPFARILNSSSIVLAMSYDCPVIAPDWPALREVLGFDSPLLYNADEPLGLRGAFAEFSRCDLGEIRRRTREACDRYRWSDVAARTLDAYGGGP